MAATIGADIIKQKMAENNGGYKAVAFGYTDERVYSQLTTDHPIDLVRYQLANCYMGRVGLINSGGAAGSNDLKVSSCGKLNMYVFHPSIQSYHLI